MTGSSRSGRRLQWRRRPQDWAFLVGLAIPPLCIAVAVLRLRLHEIDRLVSRTISYTMLTAAIALPYFMVVTVAGLLVGNNHLAVALATLVGAAVFNPLRRRIQGRVDRRFDRARYDAARTVEAFSSRLRDEVDLDSLRADLIAVVNHTVQPASASLWLR